MRFLQTGMVVVIVAALLITGACTNAGSNVNVGSVTTYRADPAQKLEKQKPAPGFQFTLPNGNLVYLNDFKGKVVLLNFWRVDCPYCKAEMPLLEKASQDRQDKVVVLGINTGDPEKRVKNFVAQEGMTFPVILDPDAYATTLYSVYYLPVTFVIDTAGNVVEAKIGAFQNSGEVDSEINLALAQTTNQ